MILEPIISGSSYYHSYSSFPKRGGFKAKQHIRKWIKKGKGIRNSAQCDIRHFFNNVQYKFVRKKLERRINDVLFLHLIDMCLIHFQKELPLGFYISQWLANFILQGLDYMIKCKCKVAHYARYMDNINMFDDNKKKLHKTIVEIKKWLGKHRLKLKRDWQVFKFDYIKKDGTTIGRPLSSMGWLIYRNKVIIRKNIMLNLSRVTRKIYRKIIQNKKIYIKHCRAFVSLLGWIKHSDNNKWFKENVNSFIIIRKIRKIISNYDKKRNNHILYI